MLLTRCNFEVTGNGQRPLTPERRAEILQINDALAGEALRTLGVAGRWLPEGMLARQETDGPDESVERDLVFAGLIGMIDPPRPEAREAVARAQACRYPPGR